MTEDRLTAAVVPLGSAAAAIDAFHEAGGVVDFVLVSVSGDFRDQRDRHRIAAVRAMDELVVREEAWIARSMAQHGSSRDQFRTTSFDGTEIDGAPIDLATFIGPGLDRTSGRLRSAWTLDADGGSSRNLDRPIAYAEAFTDPPYRVHADLETQSDWFRAINRDLFGGLDDALVIWRWSTEWSSWFDEGREWWGCAHWTIERPGWPWIVVISASATD